MPTQTLNWFPPAPAEAPRGLSLFPCDDWVLQPKYNGIRVIWHHGECFTRQGTVLADAKGAPVLREILADVSDTLDGEWIFSLPGFFPFDLPEHSGTLDERVADLCRMPHVHCVYPVHSFTTRFAETIAPWESLGYEGYVLKRRNSRYERQTRPGAEVRSWLKFRFSWR